MILGMTRAELGLTAFIFALIYGAGFLPRLGRFLGRAFSKPEAPGSSGPGTDLEGPKSSSSDLPETSDPR
jgi:hypothetical protein